MKSKMTSRAVAPMARRLITKIAALLAAVCGLQVFGWNKDGLSKIDGTQVPFQYLADATTTLDATTDQDNFSATDALYGIVRADGADANHTDLTLTAKDGDRAVVLMNPWQKINFDGDTGLTFTAIKVGSSSKMTLQVNSGNKAVVKAYDGASLTVSNAGVLTLSTDSITISPEISNTGTLSFSGAVALTCSSTVTFPSEMPTENGVITGGVGYIIPGTVDVKEGTAWTLNDNKASYLSADQAVVYSDTSSKIYSIVSGTVNLTVVAAAETVNSIYIGPSGILEIKDSSTTQITTPITGTGTIKIDIESDKSTVDDLLSSTAMKSFRGTIEITTGRYIAKTHTFPSAVTVSVKNGGQMYILGSTWPCSFTLAGNGWTGDSEEIGYAALRLDGKSKVTGKITLSEDGGYVGRVDSSSGNTGYIAGQLVGSADVLKAASGTLKITGNANLGTGKLLINGGSVQLGLDSDASAPTINMGGLTAASGTTLSLQYVTGNIGDVTLNGQAVTFHDQHDKTDTLAINNLTVNSDSKLAVNWKGVLSISALTGTGNLATTHSYNDNFSLSVGSITDYTGTYSFSGSNSFTPTIGGASQSDGKAAIVSAAVKLNDGFKKTGAGSITFTGATTLAGKINANTGTINLFGTTSGDSGALYADGAGTINIGDSDHKITATLNRIEMGDNSSSDYPSVVTIASGSTLKLTSEKDEVGSDNRYKDAGVILGEWEAATTLNVEGTFLASGASVQPGDKGFTMNIGSAGVVAVKGIGAQTAKSGKDLSVNLNLNGGDLILGSTGIGGNQADDKTSITLAGGTVGASTATLSITKPMTLSSGKTTTLDTTQYSVSSDDNTATRGSDGAAITVSGAVTGSGNLTVDGAGSVTLSGANNSIGQLMVSSGTLTISGATAIGATIANSGTLTLSENTTLSTSALSNLTKGTDVTYSAGDNGYLNDVYVVHSGTGTTTGISSLTVGTDTTTDYTVSGGKVTVTGISGTYYVNSGTVAYSTAAGKNTTGVTVKGGTLTIDETPTKTITVEGACTIYINENVTLNKSSLSIADGVTVTIDGKGIYALNDTTLGATLAGDWTGTVWLKNITGIKGTNFDSFGNGNSTVRLTGVSGWIARGCVVKPTVELVDDGETVAFTFTAGSDDTYTFSKISGSGTLVLGQNGDGKSYVIVKDVSEFTGLVNVNSATSAHYVDLLISDSLTSYDGTHSSIVIDKDVTISKAWTAAGQIVVNSDKTATFTVAADSEMTIGSVVSGAGDIAKAGAGTLTISGVNSYTGGTVVSVGTLTASTVGALGTGAVTVADGATLNFTSTTIAEGATSVNFANCGTITVNEGGSLQVGGAALPSGWTVDGGCAYDATSEAVSFVTPNAPTTAKRYIDRDAYKAFGDDSTYSQTVNGRASQVVSIIGGVLPSTTETYNIGGGIARDNETTLEKDIWLNIIGGNLGNVLGGSDSENWGGSTPNSITGNIVVEVGGNATVKNVFGGNHKDGRGPTITGNINVVVKDNAVVSGAIVGGGVGVHQATFTVTGDVGVKVTSLQRDNSAGALVGGDFSDYIVGGGVVASNSGTTQKVNGNTSVIIDLAEGVSGDFVKNIVGGGLNYNSSHNSGTASVGGNAAVTISAPSTVNFTGTIYAGSYNPYGSCSVDGTVSLTLNGGTFTSATLKGGTATGTKTLNIGGNLTLSPSKISGFDVLAVDTDKTLTLDVDSDMTLSVSAITGAIKKTGSGTLTITSLSDDDATGTITVSEGSLSLEGSCPNLTVVMDSANGTLNVGTTRPYVNLKNGYVHITATSEEVGQGQLVLKVTADAAEAKEGATTVYKPDGKTVIKTEAPTVDPVNHTVTIPFAALARITEKKSISELELADDASGEIIIQGDDDEAYDVTFDKALPANVTVTVTGYVNLKVDGTTVTELPFSQIKLSPGAVVTIDSDRLTTTGDVAIGSGATLVLSGSADATISKTLTGEGSVKLDNTSSNPITVTMAASNTFTGGLTVTSGVLAKTSSGTGFGNYTDQAAYDALSVVTVENGGAVNIDNTKGYCYRYIIEGDGVVTDAEAGTKSGAIYNSTTAMGNEDRQTSGIKLTGDATVCCNQNWGLLATGYTASKLELEGHTLTKTGSGSFIMTNVGMGDSSSGTLKISEGGLWTVTTGSGLTGYNITLDEGTTSTLAAWFDIADLTANGIVNCSATIKPTGSFTGSGTFNLKGGTLVFASDYGKSISAKVVAVSGTNTFKYGTGDGSTSFSSGDSKDAPIVTVKNGATLDFQFKDLSGWSGDVLETGWITVEQGGKLLINPHSGNASGTRYFRNHFLLAPGSTNTLDGTKSSVVVYGGHDEAKAQFYVPSGSGTAIWDSANNVGIQINDAAVTVGAGATLQMGSPLTSGSDKSSFYKYGEGTLNITNATSGFSATMTLCGGAIALPTSSTVSVVKLSTSTKVLTTTTDSAAGTITYALMDATSDKPIAPAADGKTIVVPTVPSTGITVQPGVNLKVPTGTADSQIKVKYVNGETTQDLSKYVSPSVNTETGVVTLNVTDAAKPKATQMSLPSEGDVEITVEQVPGLFYSVEEATSLDGFEGADYSQATTSDAKTHKFDLPGEGETVKYYKVSVKAQ